MSHMVAQNQVRLIPDLRSYLNDNLEYDCIPDVVDMKTKRRAFDLTMSIKRLEEEKNIVATEMQNHWKNLSTQKDNFRQLSFLLSTDSLRGMYIGDTLQCYRVHCNYSYIVMIVLQISNVGSNFVLYP